MHPLLISILLATVSSCSAGYRYCNGSLEAPWLIPPVMTPLNEDQSINYNAVYPYAQFLVENGIKSVMVGGTTGEHPTRSLDERKWFIEEWVRVGKKLGMYIIAQVGGTAYKDVEALTRFCSKAGVDAILTLPELYYKPETVEELLSYVGLVAKNAPNLPVLYYHFPQMTKVEIDMEKFIPVATAKIPNFGGLKFTSNDLNAANRAFRALQHDQELFLAADTLLAPAALLGIRSSIGAYFNLFPRLAQDIYKAFDNCDLDTARELQEKLALAVEAIEAEGSVPALKATMELVNGIKVGPPSLPQKPISAAARKRIEEKLRRLSLL